MTEKDTYKTITSHTENILFKDKNSKFFGYAYPVLNEDQVKNFIEHLKKEHHAARHWCYAYKIGVENILFRANDDGEPSNSAGMPIYNQILSFDVTNVLIVVVRYFGGVKLGVSGLINAYKTTAQLTLNNSNIIEKTINIEYLISFDYKDMNRVMRIIKEKNLNIINQKLELKCQIAISVRKKESESIFNIFDRLYEIDIKKV
ncbi:YigZ family protein [Seonamhaeicola sp. MEBiC1930]|uniref:IMPACT family protein n=1 Tax=Seonamhaeicola sp. MEBiC01930 TaxID=2976768 RepID=UPI003245C21B